MASLETYRTKRDFRSTNEPRGRKTRTKGKSFVIQMHDARRLHYDFRLELDGVLKSWAVTRGPSLVAGEKRLAVHVEDHPLDYGDFEGTIPKGSYGAGTVIVWDRGTWEPVSDPRTGYAKGHLEFELYGDKLAGRWHLVRMQKKDGEKRDNWLLIKADDETARPEDATDILKERPESAMTGRLITEVEDAAGPAKTGKTAPADEGRGKSKARPRGSKAQMPDFVPPQLATLKPSPPKGSRHIHEIKFDGYRLQARIETGEVRLLTRGGLDWTDKFGKEVIAALKKLPLDTAIPDGEMVVEGGSGASDFSALQADLTEGRSDRFVYYAFDLLYLDGEDLRGLGLEDRKRRLQQLISSEQGPIRFSSHFEDNGDLVLQHACRLSLEGVISKLRDAPYRSGRSRDWIKSKCSARQEFVVAGFMPSTTSKKAVGSLLLGVYDDGNLEHVGRVGTGFTRQVAADLFKRLDKIRTAESPFAKPLTAEQGRAVTFVKPELVAEVEFGAWTADGHLRHAAYRGLREDKPAEAATREQPAKASKGVPKPQARRVKLTHPDRVYWPDAGVTKEGLADYYADVWRYVAPHICGRPLALLRCPNGISGPSFFQKHAWKGMSGNVLQVDDPDDRKADAFIAIDSLDGLISLVQSAVLEIHPWGSTLKDWNHPDQIVMDLDPGEGVDWQRIIEAALETRQRLQDAGLRSFVKTSGGKGLHVVAPLVPSADWADVKRFAKSLATAMASDSPDRYVATISKAKRKGKILVDYLRNQRGMTAVAPYSTRARPGAPVSMPLAWEELTPAIGPNYFTVDNTAARLSNQERDPWSGFRHAAGKLKTKAR